MFNFKKFRKYIKFKVRGKEGLRDSFNSLFSLDEKQEIDIQKLQFLEFFLYFFIKLLGLYFVYVLFNYLGTRFFVNNFNTDTLFSIFSLPFIEILVSSQNILSSLFIEIQINKDFVTVKRGYFNKNIDTLRLEYIDNIESHASVFGRIFGYTTLDLYSFGGVIQLPFIKNTKKNSNILQDLIKETMRGHKKDTKNAGNN